MQSAAEATDRASNIRYRFSVVVHFMIKFQMSIKEATTERRGCLGDPQDEGQVLARRTFYRSQEWAHR